MDQVGRASGTRTTAFGLDIDSATPISFLDGAPAAPTGRELSLSVRPDEAAAARWPTSGSSLICDEVNLDGSVNFRIQSHPEGGYLIAGPAYGAHLLAPDGRSLICFPEAQPESAWQRLLIAQVLPFAALLHGLEVLHASAVVHEDQAVALLGPSSLGQDLARARAVRPRRALPRRRRARAGDARRGAARQSRHRHSPASTRRGRCPMSTGDLPRATWWPRTTRERMVRMRARSRARAAAHAVLPRPT